jgi:hypothetical protein
MTKTTNAQLPKLVVGAMMDVDINLTPLKVIGREACL